MTWHPSLPPRSKLTKRNPTNIKLVPPNTVRYSELKQPWVGTAFRSHDELSA